MAPVVSIVCNFTRPVGDAPALLSLDETETFFHEFGHALHFLFHDVRYRGLAEVEGDFVELPSQIMENWAFEPEVLTSRNRPASVFASSRIFLARGVKSRRGFLHAKVRRN